LPVRQPPELAAPHQLRVQEPDLGHLPRRLLEPGFADLVCPQLQARGDVGQVAAHQPQQGPQDGQRRHAEDQAGARGAVARHVPGQPAASRRLRRSRSRPAARSSARCRATSTAGPRRMRTTPGNQRNGPNSTEPSPPRSHTGTGRSVSRTTPRPQCTPQTPQDPAMRHKALEIKWLWRCRYLSTPRRASRSRPRTPRTSPRTAVPEPLRHDPATWDHLA
jgi:hypothetical protein